MQWIATLINRLTCFIPRPWLVNPDEAGVKITAKWPWSGVWIKEIGPGLYWYVPLFQDIGVLKTKIQTEDLRAQSITTKTTADSPGKPVVVSGGIQYYVTNAKKALLDVYDLDKNLLNTVLGIIAKFINGRTFEECKDIESLEKEILKGAREAAAGWGVKITRVFISDLVAAKTYRLINGARVLNGNGEASDS